MNTLREKFYQLSGYSAGVCVVMIMIIILAQVIGRLLGFIIPSAEDVSGYALAASTFFGLAYTLHNGGHVRVTLVIQKFSGRARQVQELIVLIFSFGLACFMTFYCFQMVWESYVFEEVSHGYIPIPIWIPQSSVAIGLLALNIALLDSLIAVIRKQKPAYQHQEDESSLEEL